jgi:hypothetical protein
MGREQTAVTEQVSISVTARASLILKASARAATRLPGQGSCPRPAQASVAAHYRADTGAQPCPRAALRSATGSAAREQQCATRCVLLRARARPWANSEISACAGRLSCVPVLSRKNGGVVTRHQTAAQSSAVRQELGWLVTGLPGRRALSSTRTAGASRYQSRGIAGMAFIGVCHVVALRCGLRSMADMSWGRKQVSMLGMFWVGSTGAVKCTFAQGRRSSGWHLRVINS